MSEMKFTPGPWYVRDSMRELMGEPVAFCIDAAPTCCVADVWSDDAQAEGNARLIAAAPELYAALKACHLQMLQSSNSSEYAEEANQLAIAALTKAEGKATT